MTSSNPDGASVRASSAISAKVGGTTTMRGRGTGEVNAELAIGAVLVVPEYYIETGSRRPHLWARWATGCARGWKRPIMSTWGPALSRFSLTMNELAAYLRSTSSSGWRL